jgi:hypothetical protein
MVEVDVFWSYGIGAGFAVGAARQLKARAARVEQVDAAPFDPDTEQRLVEAGIEPRPRPGLLGLLEYRRMVYNILFAALLFAPSGIVLLWGHPNWETMQAGDFSMPAWLIGLFAITNVTQSILGFWVVERLLARGRNYLAYLQLTFGYFGIFFILVHGWDGRGWQRFFSPDKSAFANWSNHSALDNATSWLTSDVALTLYAMGIVLIPVMTLMVVRNLREGYALRLLGTERSPAPIVLAIWFGVGALVAPLTLAIAASLVIHGAQSLVSGPAGTAIGVLAFAALAYGVALREGGLLHRVHAFTAADRPQPSEPSGGLSSRYAAAR